MGQLLAAGLSNGEVVAIGRGRELPSWLREGSFDGARGAWLAGTERGQFRSLVQAVLRRGPELIPDVLREPTRDIEVRGEFPVDEPPSWWFRADVGSWT